MSLNTQLSTIRSQIAEAAQAVGRNAADVALMAVSKTQSAERCAALLEAGQRLFGENRVQEAATKWPALREAYPDLDLHLIGPLQTNKVRQAVELFDAIDSLDRPKLARCLADEMARVGKSLPLLVQINTGAEPQKAGILPNEADAFLTLCRKEYHLDLRGLMCIPPADQEDPSPDFHLLAKIAADHGLTTLSMGMSHDFPAAIACGATCVRVGTALFGARPPLQLSANGN